MGRTIPTKIKKLQGTLKKCRSVNEMDVSVEDRRPEPPEYLSEVGKKVWEQTTWELQNLKMLHLVDMPSLTAYVFNVELSYTLPAEIKKEGLVTIHTNKAGEANPVKNPKLAIYNEALRNLHLFGVKFGFDPVSRSKINAPEKPEESEREKMRRAL